MIKEIIKQYNEGKSIEELSDMYCNSWCMAEEIHCAYPNECVGDEYCKECWANKIKEIVSEN
ncbi:hypothetical protein CBU02nite_32510 [Clostridium butyricum]|uniref:Uncharacterized protein n=1 Tax=Clostridium butyricum TaxID=1492 RepID=A0A512TRB6_CLOBU|nr:hypothetical protein [Clostridium butyricum]NOW22130.1 hypothetical protein [Clostridium butyricum]GEQ22745.1 hypothetical protein CBU02nite_32510 [Clostridium butyricum]